MVEITALEKNKEKRMKKNWGLWDNIKCINIHIIRVLEEEREKGYDKTFKEIIAENF